MRISGFSIITLLLTGTTVSTVIILNDDPNKGHKVEGDDNKVGTPVGAVEETPDSETIFLVVDDTKHGGDLVSILSAKLGDDGLSLSSKVDLGLAGVDGDLDQLKAVSKDLSELGESFKVNELLYGDKTSDSSTKEEHSLISVPTVLSSEAQTEKPTSLLSTDEVFPASRPTMANRLAPTTAWISTTTGDVPTVDVLHGKPETSKTSDHTISSTNVPLSLDVKSPTATQESALAPTTSQTTLTEPQVPKPLTVEVPKGEMKSLQKEAADLQTSNSQALEPLVPAIPSVPLAEASVTPVVAIPAVEQPSATSAEQSSSIASPVIGESTHSEQTVHANTIGHANIEEIIRDSVEKYLKEGMDKLGRHSKEAEENKVSEEKASPHTNLTPLEDVRHVEISLPIGSGSNNETSKFVSEPIHFSDPALEYSGRSDSLSDLNLDDGLEHLNNERLKNALKAVLNDAKESNTSGPQIEVPFGAFPENQAEGFRNREPNLILESDPVFPHEHISEYSRPITGNQREQSPVGNKRKPLSTFESITYIKENLGLLKAFVKNLDKVTTEGLSDKDNKDIKWSDYNLSRLKKIPQEVLDIILSDDKRQTFDNIVHRPFLKKIALDVTSLDENQIDLLIDELVEETKGVLSDEVVQKEEDKPDDDHQEQDGSDRVESDHDYSDVDEASEADENKARLVGEETFTQKLREKHQLEHKSKDPTGKMPTQKSFENPLNLDSEIETPREKSLNAMELYETSYEEDDGFKPIEKSKARFVFDQKKRIGLRNKESEIEEEDIEKILFNKESSLQNEDEYLEDKDIASENPNKKPTKTDRSSERPTKTAQNSPHPKSTSIAPESLKEHSKNSNAGYSSSSNRNETIKGKSTKPKENTLLDKKSGTPKAVHKNPDNESLMEKFKKNPSLLFTGSINENKDGTSHGSGSDDSLFDFTRSSGHKNNVFRFENWPTYVLVVLLVLAPFV